MGFARRTSRTITGFVLAATLSGAALGMAMAQEIQPVAPVQGKAKRPPAAPAAAKQPESVQSSIETAGQLLDSGKTDQAVDKLTSAIASSNLPTPLMARALYLRGKAYRQQAKPALAISDLTSALWLKNGLNPADRTDATLQRAGAYTEAGLTEHGQALASSSAASGRGIAQSANSTTAAGNTVRSGVVGATPSAPAVPAPVAAPPQRLPAPAVAATIATATIHAPAAPARAASAGRFQSRVALVRTRPEAEAIVARLKGQYAAVLADRAPDIGQTSFGNMGTYFQVRVGPFATAKEATSVCTQLRGSGLDCVAVDQ